MPKAIGARVREFLLRRNDNYPRLLAVTAQLGLVLVVANLFVVERAYGFLEITPIIFVGFIIHALLPQRARLPFFLLLSLGCIGVILGRTGGALVILLGLGLLAICHLPVRFSIRVVLLLGAGALLAAIRGGWILDRWNSLSSLVLPVLGAMFMFRLIIYMYELRHEKEPATIWERLSYFFMLPNVCFLLFPVVDYRTFRRTYYNADANEIYQKGVTWIFRGITHLLVYRLVYYELLPVASEVTDLTGVLRYIATTYLLYLRISGQFHLIVGIMCLFGFNLPETHHLYYLASSFNDYWRRINIYWKDFMMKIFYYPSLNRLRKRGLVFAIAVSTMVVFAGTWLLHSNQWFWLQGSFPITAPDALFWGTLGVLVVINAVYESKRGRRRSLGKQAFTWTGALQHAAKVVGMLVVISILWTMWSSDTLEDFAALMEIAARAHPTEYLFFAAALAILVALGVLIQYVNSRGITLTLAGASPSFGRAAAVTSLGSAALLLFCLPELRVAAGPPAVTVFASLRNEGLNQQDQERRLLGYYEGLLDARGYMAAQFDVRGKAATPPDWGDLSTSIVTRETGDILQYEHRPNAEDVLSRATFNVNRWGMRDQDYTMEKPPTTFRIAMIGASYVVGAGVEQPETFEALIEDRLNREKVGGPYQGYESLNFAVGGYDPIRTLVNVRRRMPAFEPDMVCYIVHLNDGWRLRQNLATAVEKGFDVVDPHVQSILDEAGVESTMPRVEIQRRLDPFVAELWQWSYSRLGEVLRAHGIEPVAFILPRIIETGDESLDSSRERLLERLRNAGFTAYDLWDVYGDLPMASLWLGPWDEHPNVLGHQLIAEAIYSRLEGGGHLPDADDFNPVDREPRELEALVSQSIKPSSDNADTD